MTVKHLKYLLSNYPDDAEVYCEMVEERYRELWKNCIVKRRDPEVEEGEPEDTIDFMLLESWILDPKDMGRVYLRLHY